MTSTRIVAVLAALTLLTACQTDVEPVRGEDILEQAREALDDLRGDDPASPDDQPEPDPVDPSQPDPAEREPGDEAQPPPLMDDGGPPAQDRAGLGAMCRTYLRGDMPRLVIEVAHQTGALPTSTAVEHMTRTLDGVLDKPGGIDVRPVEVPGGPQTWNHNDLRAVADRHRVELSSGEQAVMQVLALRGQFEDPETLGIAFDASTFAIFPDRIDGLARLLGGRSAMERSILVHEAGHLLCLINVGYTSDIDHEDPEHPGHSSDQRSVMYWAVANSAVAQVFTGPPPDDFTENDRADLDGLRTGRY